MRKQARDFVYIDELWEADKYWPHYFIGSQVWIYADEYRAELDGDEDYSRIIINQGSERGWIYKRRLADKPQVIFILKNVERPISQAQLKTLGFIQWSGRDAY